jgi:hypothetical protein
MTAGNKKALVSEGFNDESNSRCLKNPEALSRLAAFDPSFSGQKSKSSVAVTQNPAGFVAVRSAPDMAC